MSLLGYGRLAIEGGTGAATPSSERATGGAAVSMGVASGEENPAKRSRRKVRPESVQNVSMFRLRELWLMPFLAEAILLFGAGWMSYCLFRVVQDPRAGFPLSSIVVLALAYAGLATYSRLHELFLPRKVVFLGIGAMLLISVCATISAMVDAFLIGGRGRLINATLVLTPMHLFTLRCLMIFREARYTPSAACLVKRLHSKGERMEELRRKLRFWLS